MKHLKIIIYIVIVFVIYLTALSSMARADQYYGKYLKYKKKYERLKKEYKRLNKEKEKLGSDCESYYIDLNQCQSVLNGTNDSRWTDNY